MACLFCSLGLEDVDVVVMVFLNIDSLIFRHFSHSLLSENIGTTGHRHSLPFVCFPECKDMPRMHKFEIRYLRVKGNVLA